MVCRPLRQTSSTTPFSLNAVTLPLELIPLILDHLQSPAHLRSASLVCRAWNVFSNEVLYSHVWVKPWEKGAEEKLTLLFHTLGRVSELGRLVKKLEIRSYPPPVTLPSSLASTTLLTLLNLPNLTSLVWTRDRSLSMALLSVIAVSMPNLVDLEINAHSSGVFEPEALLKITGLKRMGLIMPDRGTVSVLQRWWEILREKGGGLERLMVISQSSPLITDALLLASAPSLVNLTHLSLTSLTKITTASIVLLLTNAACPPSDDVRVGGPRGITHLALEHLPRLSCTDISNVLSSLALPTFIYLSLTLPHGCNSFFLNSLLVKHAQTLQTLHLSLPTPNQASETLVLPYLPELRLLSIPSPLVLDLSTTTSCQQSLRYLFLPVQARDWPRLLDAVASSPDLRTVHIVSPQASAEGIAAWEPGTRELTQLARRARGLRQVGFRTRVWDVHRSEEEEEYWTQGKGGLRREKLVLERFDSELGGRVPDVFALGRFLG